MKNAVHLGRKQHCSFLLALATVGLLGTTRDAFSLDLCIPPHEGLPYSASPPTIDGYVDRVFGLPGLTSDPLEPGWARSGIFSYGYGGTSADMEFRGVKHNSDDFFYMSFVVQFDKAFDDMDAIAIVIDPDWNNASTDFSSNARRVEVRPVIAGAGAPGLAGTSPAGATSPLIRSDRSPFSVEWKRFVASTLPNTPGSWTAMSSGPTNHDIKVRSWEVSASDVGWSVEIKLPSTTAKGGSGWPDLGSSFGLYANVVRVCGANACANDPVNLRSFLVNQFTWPRTSYTPGSSDYRVITGNYQNLSKAFDKIKVNWLGLATFGSANVNCRGVRFANGGPSGIGIRESNNTLGTNIDAQNQATNTLVARVINDGDSAAGKAVRAEFRIANWGINGGPGVWTPVPARPSNATISAGPLNANTTNSNHTARVDIPTGGGSHDIWMTTQVLSTDNYCDPNRQSCGTGTKNAHSCIWVLLDSNQGATISEASVRRNFDIINLSHRQRSAEISAKGWDKPAGPLRTQQFLLTESHRVLVSPGNRENLKEVAAATKGYGVPVSFLLPPDEKLRPAELMSPLEHELLRTEGLGKAPLWNYISEVHAQRATTETLTIGQTTYRIYEPAGTFGTIGQHFGKVERFESRLSAPNNPLFRPVEGTTGSYSITIPDGHVARLDTMIAALEPGEPEPPKPCKPGCSRCPTLSSQGPGDGVPASALLMVGMFGASGLALRIRRRKADRGDAPDNAGNPRD